LRAEGFGTTVADSVDASAPIDAARTQGWKRSQALPWVVALTIWLLVLVLPLRSEFAAPIGPQDEGLLLVYPALMLHGAVPNGTFESVYGAGSYWPIAGAFAVFGSSVAVERCVALLYWIVLSGSLFGLVARRRGPLTGALAASASVLLLAGPIGLIAYAWVGAVALGALGLFFLDHARRRGGAGRGWSLAAGVAFGLAVSYRLDLALAVGLVLGLLCFVDRGRLRTVLPGVGIGLLPLLVNVVQAGLAAVVRGQLIGPTFDTGPGRHLPLDRSGFGGELALALSIAATVALIWLGFLAVRRGESLIPLAAGLFAAGLLPQGFQRADGIHVAYVACFVLPSVLLAPLPQARHAGRGRTSPLAGVLAGVALLVLVWPLSWSTYRAQVARSIGVDPNPRYVVTNQGRSVLLTSAQQVQDLEQLLRTLDRRAAPQARVFVGPDDMRRTNLTDTYIYFLLPQLTPGTFYLEMEPDVANAPDSGLARQVRGDEWLVLTSEWDGWNEPNASMVYRSDAPNRVVRSDFSKVGAWGPWELLQRDPGR
jgi:hypothetical protein